MAGVSLWEMRGRVKQLAPNRSDEFVEGAINKYIRIVTRRNWADLLRVAQIVIPNAYTTGTVAFSPGSNLVNGTATSWPTNDAVNTTLSAAVTEAPGYVDVTPVSMAGIKVGQYLLLDSGASMEIVVPVAVSATRFLAYCQLPHASAVVVKASSLAGLQLRSNAYVYTVMAALSGTQLQLDMPYGGPAVSGLAYQIYLAYTSISSTARRLMHATDAIAGSAIEVGKTVDWLEQQDPQRTSSGPPQALVSTNPNPGGSMQWEIWPAQLSAYALKAIYQDTWPTLRRANDLSPYFINAEIFIAGAQADALGTRFIERQQKIDPYYDLARSGVLLQQYQDLLDHDIDSDQGRYLTTLQSYREQLAGAGNYNYQRAHVGWPSDFGG